MNAAHTNHRKEKAGGQPGDFSAAATKHNLNFATVEDREKAFSAWQARFAMHGHSLYQATVANGATAFLVTRWGMVRELTNLEEVEKFFSLIGGKL